MDKYVINNLMTTLYVFAVKNKKKKIYIHLDKEKDLIKELVNKNLNFLFNDKSYIEI